MRSLLALVLLAAGCECGPSCDGLSCGPCPPAVTLTILTDGAMPTVAGDVELMCSTTGDTTSCRSRVDEPLAPGAYLFVISAPGHATAEATLMVEPGGSGCCACPVSGDEATVDLDASDGGLVGDGGADQDAGVADGGDVRDAGADGGAACRPERVDGHPFAIGSFCDEIYACARDEEEAARVEAASPDFECAPSAPCANLRCDYHAGGGPIPIDDAVYRDVCAVTVLEPPPASISCWVWL